MKRFIRSLFIFFGLVLNLACQTTSLEKPKEKFQANVLIGSYTNKDILAHLPMSNTPGKGIYSFAFSNEGSLKALDVTPAVNPAVLILHPNHKILYSITENIDNNGSIDTFDINEDGSLVLQGTFPASGKSTCFLTVTPDQKRAIVVNYWDAKVDVVSLNNQGYLNSHVQNFRHQLSPFSRQVMTREDHWVNRQVGPHAHSAHFWKGVVYIPDLGENAIFQYRYTAKGFLEKEAIIPLEKGAGPRHMVIHEQLGVAYVSNELKSTVVIAKLDASEMEKHKARFNPIQYVSTIPQDFKQKNYVSEVKMSNDGRFLYVSNRGHDSIAVYSIDQKTGQLSLLANTPTGGKFPRHFALSPKGDYLLVANQDSNFVNVFSRDINSGLLSETKYGVEVPTPNFVRFI